MKLLPIVYNTNIRHFYKTSKLVAWHNKGKFMPWPYYWLLVAGLIAWIIVLFNLVWSGYETLASSAH